MNNVLPVLPRSTQATLAESGENDADVTYWREIFRSHRVRPVSTSNARTNPHAPANPVAPSGEMASQNEPLILLRTELLPDSMDHTFTTPRSSALTMCLPSAVHSTE
jgi:hypothetical protein